MTNETREHRKRIAEFDRREWDSRNSIHGVATAMVERMDPDHKLAVYQRLELSNYLQAKLFWEWPTETYKQFIDG